MTWQAFLAKRWRSLLAGALLAAFSITTPLLASAARDEPTKAVRLDRVALHRTAIEESLLPIRPGIPGERLFWNSRSGGFIYAPAFEFHAVEGAARYRFEVLAYGTKQWSFESADPTASLQPLWAELPPGRLFVERMALDAHGNNRAGRNTLPRGEWVVKSATSVAPSFQAAPSKAASKYRFTVWQAKDLTFEAEQPWATLSPIWRDVPPGRVVLTVEGLDPAGKSVGLASTTVAGRGPAVTFRRFHRKATFAGPYHESMLDYRDGAYRWLTWLAANEFKVWAGRRVPTRLTGYPSKFVGAAVSGMTLLAELEQDAQRRKEHLRVARKAANALIAASFPAQWGLAHFPPTYDRGQRTVMMNYPASIGMAYLDLYAATGDQAMLDAARRIADTYRKTQRASGSWPLLMDARQGTQVPRSSTELVPAGAVTFFERLIESHGFEEYRPMADAAWQWIEREIVATFRFEGQFEDTGKGGGRPWNLSHYPATRIAEHLFRRSRMEPAQLARAEELIRFAEDQFVVWQPPLAGEHGRSIRQREPVTPRVLEQYVYMVPISASAADMLRAFQIAYEFTGKELYLAKAAAIANVMTVLQARRGARFVPTYWDSPNPGGWPNAHVHGARALAAFGEMMMRRNLTIVLGKR